ncbi:hypothetical protein C5E45_22275 [Nocardia nova]|uniref:Uncharacterized protein n=1 Tax=Nocardia nova TaxID=37330 RepID=A0A2S6ALL8_9NOCA|nr:hypothetical protein [Nocardia nova]PPJ26956.1 hypothetical protein C5E41_16910 [Nocardia nova]PPJ36125.1 hypothetical protein C5E45_22275 [Nocardia nova]
MDDLQRRVLTALTSARRGLKTADARLLERRIVGLRAEVDAAGYPRPQHPRLKASCAEALAAARWTLGRPNPQAFRSAMQAAS